MAGKKPMRDDSKARELAFDVTQEIDPTLADQLRRSAEPTLTQAEFDDITVALPPPKHR
jgi:hypothetical protein